MNAEGIKLKFVLYCRILPSPAASFFVLSLAEFCYKQSALQKVALLINDYKDAGR